VLPPASTVPITVALSPPCPSTSTLKVFAIGVPASAVAGTAYARHVASPHIRTMRARVILRPQGACLAKTNACTAPALEAGGGRGSGPAFHSEAGLGLIPYSASLSAVGTRSDRQVLGEGSLCLRLPAAAGVAVVVRTSPSVGPALTLLKQQRAPGGVEVSLPLEYEAEGRKLARVGRRRRTTIRLRPSSGPRRRTSRLHSKDASSERWRSMDATSRWTGSA
jgi:hypothetical protein